jgi:hypothetical protein
MEQILMAKALMFVDVLGIRRRLSEQLKERTPAEVEAWLTRRGLTSQSDGLWTGNDEKLDGLRTGEYTVLQRL